MTAVLAMDLRSPEGDAAFEARPPDEARKFYDFSEEFFGYYRDVLPEKFGCVAAFGTNRRGQLGAPEVCEGNEVAVLIFDARAQSSGVYRWQLSVTDGRGREVLVVETSPRGVALGSASFDMQGRKQLGSSFEDASATEWLGHIQVLAQEPVVEAQAAAKRNLLAVRQAELSKLLPIKKPGSYTYIQKRIRTLEKEIEHGMGFPALYPLADDQITWHT